MNAYVMVMSCAMMVILSYLFNIISKKSKIPSVLLLIITGIALNQGAAILEFDINFNLQPVLEVLGIVGLIMIVLEAALDLELTKENWPVLWKSTLVAVIGLVGSAIAIGAIFHHYFAMDWLQAVLYATPLSILSSAIIIPSVESLSPKKREFMIYESTFSDILGIMLFYLVLSAMGDSTHQEVAGDFLLNLLLTIVVSFVVSYGLVLLFQNIRTHVKMFLIMSVLLVLFSVAKLFHLSSLLIILIFGLVLNNHHLFFRGFLARWIKQDRLPEITEDFKTITAETAFVVRTFFFVLFGFTVKVASLIDTYVAIMSAILLLTIYLLRGATIRLIFGKNNNPMTYIAPRGLITVLLFFAIPEEFHSEQFDSGILLFVMLASSLVMTSALVRYEEGEPATEPVIDDAPEEVTPEPGTELYDENGLYIGVQEEEVVEGPSEDSVADSSSDSSGGDEDDPEDKHLDVSG